MSEIINKPIKGFKSIAEYRKAHADLVQKYCDAAYNNIQALTFSKSNVDLSVTASLYGFARELKELNEKWINSNLETDEPLTNAEKKDGEGADRYDTERDSVLCEKPNHITNLNTLNK